MRKYIPSESIDLIYLDPPFNSNESYNVLFKSRDKQPNSQITAFEDTWHWNQTSEDAYDEVMQSDNVKAATAIEGLRQILGESDIMAYLCMMCVRLLEMHRVLKVTGSMYLHCDPAASHYLKVVMDSIFNADNFLNEIIWKRYGSHNDSTRYANVHDTILYYAKNKNKRVWNKIYQDYDPEYIKHAYSNKDENGPYTTSPLQARSLSGGGYDYQWHGINETWKFPKKRLDQLEADGLIHWPKAGSTPRRKVYLKDVKGLAPTDMFLDTKSLSSANKERIGYPTQKPIALLERIIRASSKEGQIVLDPFCGCGTAVHAAEKMQRRWIGIDITHLAINIMEDRMKSAFPGIKFRVDGLPQSTVDAHKLFKLDPFQFELWAIQRIIPGMQVTSKTGDQGIDGVGRAPVGKDENGRTKYAKIIASVKGGKNTLPSYMNELQGNLAKHNADMGVLLTLEDLPKRSEIVKICTKAGKYMVDTVTGPMHYPRLQTFKVGDVFEGRRPDLPSLMQSVAMAAPAMKRTRGTQSTLTD